MNIFGFKILGAIILCLPCVALWASTIGPQGHLTIGHGIVHFSTRYHLDGHKLHIRNYPKKINLGHQYFYERKSKLKKFYSLGVFPEGPKLYFKSLQDQKNFINKMNQLAMKSWHDKLLNLENNFPENYHPSENSALILSKGHDAFKERVRGILKAKKNIYIKTYLFHGDEVGQALFQLLFNQKIIKDLDIRIEVDPLNFWKFNLDHKKDLIKNTHHLMWNFMVAGIPVRGFKCYPPKKVEIADFVKAPIKSTQIQHQKSFIIDDYWAIIGGLNTSKSYFHLGNDPWTDLDISLKGPISQEVLSEFEFNWKTVNRKKQPCLNPHPVNSKEWWEFFIKNYKEFNRPLKNDGSAEILSKLISEVKDEKETPNYNKVKAIYVKGTPLIDGGGRNNPIEKVYLDQIKKAQKEIIIVNPYWIPSTSMTMALVQAKSRGVDVHILTNGVYTNDIYLMALTSRDHYSKLFKNKCRKHNHPQMGLLNISEFRAEKFIKKTNQKYSGGMLHAKYALFDRSRTIVGSYNIDPRSRHTSEEHAVLAEGHDLSQSVLESFLYRYSENSILSQSTIKRMSIKKGIKRKWKHFQSILFHSYL